MDGFHPPDDTFTGEQGARMTQIMNLLLLAPDIQEEILFLPRTTEGRHHLTERSLRAAIAEPSFVEQRHIRGGIRQTTGLASDQA